MPMANEEGATLLLKAQMWIKHPEERKRTVGKKFSCPADLSPKEKNNISNSHSVDSAHSQSSSCLWTNRVSSNPFFWPCHFNVKFINSVVKSTGFYTSDGPMLSTSALFTIPQLTCCLLNPVLKAITFTSAVINQTTRTVTCKTA